MSLIRDGVMFTTRKVSDSVASHHQVSDQSNPPQEPDDSSHKDSLHHQNNQPLESRRSTASVDQARYGGTENPQQQSEQQWSLYPSNEPYRALTSAQPTLYQSQDQQQTIRDNTFVRHAPVSDMPTSQTAGYRDPGQHHPLTEQGRANQDCNRADFYQAKYYEARQAQAGQYQGQSIQYGDDGMGGYQQNGRRGGRGGVRGRGRRGRGGLFGMLMNR